MATAILALILVLFSSLLTTALDSLRSLNNSTKQRQDARVVLANMAAELKESLSSPSISYEINDPAARQFQLLINPPNMGELANAHTVFWASAANSSNGSGLIGYAVRWDKTNPNAPRPRLCRMFIPLDKNQQNIVDLKAVSSAFWAKPELLNNFAPADEANGYQGWLADNVIALFVRALDPQQQPITRAARTITGMTSPGSIWYVAMSGVKFHTDLQGPAYVNPDPSNPTDTNKGYDSRTGYQYWHPTATEPTGFKLLNRFGPALPASIEIVLVVGSPEAIGRLTSVPTPVPGSSSSTMWTDIKTFIDSLPPGLKSSVRTYSTIVSLSQLP